MQGVREQQQHRLAHAHAPAEHRLLELRRHNDRRAHDGEQLKQRAAKLSTDAASAEGMAADWARKGSSEDIKDKADSFKRMAARLSERAGKFKGEKKTYIYHTEYT